jgi:hypothetical protein
MSAERERYLQRAGEARALADTANPALRDDFLRIAESWEMLARSLEDGADNRRVGTSPALRG